MTPTTCGPLLPGLAEPIHQRLANGVDIVSLPMEEAPLVCIDFWCRAGSVYERQGESGLAHFLEHMVFKGSEGLKAGEFDRRVEALGGSSNAATGFDDVHYHVLIPPAGAEEALDLLLDLVLRPRLEEKAFAMERQVVLEELAQSEDQPEEVVVQQLLRLACPHHPYGEPILGRREALLAHDPAAMHRFHDRLYAAGRCVLALSGALASCQLERRAAGGPLTALGASPDGMEPADLVVVPGEHRITVPRLESARLLMAWWQPAAEDIEAVMGADLATSMLAEGRGSRLVHHLREELRIVESVDLDLHPMEHGSLALLEAVCEPEDLPSVRSAIEAVWRDLIHEPVGEAEWHRARRLVTNGYRFGLESPGGVACLIGNAQLWRRLRGLQEPLRMIERWTASTLRDRALPLLDPARACVLEAVPA